MTAAARRKWGRVLMPVSLGVGVLLGRGLEICFGVGQYRLIMLFGALAGAGIGLLFWVARIAWERDGEPPRRAAIAGTIPGLVVFLFYFLWRVLPLIREELKYSL